MCTTHLRLPATCLSTVLVLFLSSLVCAISTDQLHAGEAPTTVDAVIDAWSRYQRHVKSAAFTWTESIGIPEGADQAYTPATLRSFLASDVVRNSIAEGEEGPKR